MGSRPWLQFYPSDWRGDPKLRICSLAARGLWIEMIALMHEANPRGHLLVNGIAPNEQQLSALTGTNAEQVSIWLSELESAGVFSRTDSGVIYSRRMTRDEQKAEISRKNGLQGGRPKKPGPEPNQNPEANPNGTSQIPDTRYQKKKSLCPKRKRVSYPNDFEAFWKGYPTDANMSKVEAFAQWERLEEEDRAAAAKSLEAFSYYCKRNPDYRPIHACRYLKNRRFDGHVKQVEEVREKQRPSFKFARGAPQYLAWNDYRTARGQPQLHKDEWWFPSEWPPGHPQGVT